MPKDDKKCALRLWILLDDIDTASDIAKGNDIHYRVMTTAIQKRRWEILNEQDIDEMVDEGDP